ncbi:hypothetical protein [Pseudonocardia spirodelae]|uniref:WXG100 family type VII secretion target n=1 Tax=Pseudonocardia spirodelae TaxID=3133431 RepID=A0ABU8T8L3_9PSEU
MTVPADDGVQRQAAALRELVGELDDTARLLTGVRDAVTAAWDDAAGREWTGRLDLVGREVRRLADEAAQDRAYRDGPAGDGASGGPAVHDEAPAAGPGAGGPQDPGGVRAPGLPGLRTTGRRGVVAPALPPLTDGAPR